jgi:hypothetical protein
MGVYRLSLNENILHQNFTLYYCLLLKTFIAFGDLAILPRPAHFLFVVDNELLLSERLGIDSLAAKF